MSRCRALKQLTHEYYCEERPEHMAVLYQRCHELYEQNKDLGFSGKLSKVDSDNKQIGGNRE